MTLEGIIAISGKPGLFKLLSRNRSGFIVEQLPSGKKTVVSATNNVSLLENVAMYTFEEEVALIDVFKSISKKENGGLAVSHKADSKELHAYFETVLPNYDKDRVYNSDLKKLFQWYNILSEIGLTSLEDTKEEE